VEEFRAYARAHGQVFVSTHSPEFLNASRLDEIYWLVKEDGFTNVRRASDNELFAASSRKATRRVRSGSKGSLRGGRAMSRVVFLASSRHGGSRACGSSSCATTTAVTAGA